MITQWNCLIQMSADSRSKEVVVWSKSHCSSWEKELYLTSEEADVLHTLVKNNLCGYVNLLKVSFYSSLMENRFENMLEDKLKDKCIFFYTLHTIRIYDDSKEPGYILVYR